MMRVQERKGGKEMKRLRGLSDTEDSCMRRLVREWRALLSLWSHRAPLVCRIFSSRASSIMRRVYFSIIFRCVSLFHTFHVFPHLHWFWSFAFGIPTNTHRYAYGYARRN